MPTLVGDVAAELTAALRNTAIRIALNGADTKVRVLMRSPSAGFIRICRRRQIVALKNRPGYWPGDAGTFGALQHSAVDDESTFDLQFGEGCLCQRELTLAPSAAARHHWKRRWNYRLY